MSLLTRDAILKVDDRNYETVEVPEWGGEVRVSVISGNARDEFELAMSKQQDKGGLGKGNGIRASLVAQACVDEAGNRLFQVRDAKALGQKSARALNRVFEVACRLNGIGDEDVIALEGNSQSETNEGSGSSSHAQ